MHLGLDDDYRTGRAYDFGAGLRPLTYMSDRRAVVESERDWRGSENAGRVARFTLRAKLPPAEKTDRRYLIVVYFE